MALFSVTIDGVALAISTAKTIIELGVPVGRRARIVRWWCEFDGVTAGAVPAKVEFQRASAGVTTATGATSEKLDPDDAQTSVVVAKVNTTVEGAGTLSGGEIHRLLPNGSVSYPEYQDYRYGREWVIGSGGFWRLRVTAAAAVNVTAGIIWEEQRDFSKVTTEWYTPR